MSLEQSVQVKQVTTSDATPTNVSTAAITLGDDREGYAECVLVLKSGSDVKTMKVGGTVKRAAAGAASIVGTIQSILTAQGDVGLAAAIATLVASGNTVVPQVTGIAATTIIWDVWHTITFKP